MGAFYIFLIKANSKKKIPLSLLTVQQPYFLKVDYTNSEEGWPGCRKGHEDRPEGSEVGGAEVGGEEAARR